MKFKIITGTASECEKVLNELMKNHYLSIEGFSATNETTTILVQLQSNK